MVVDLETRMETTVAHMHIIEKMEMEEGTHIVNHVKYRKCNLKEIEDCKVVTGKNVASGPYYNDW